MLTGPGANPPVVVEGLGRTVVEVVEASVVGVPVEAVRRGVQLVRDAAIDTIVSIGGGATVDAAKAIAFFTEREAGTPGTSFTDRPVLAHVAIPTTLSTSAFSSSFAMTDPATKHRQSTSSPTLVPRWVVLDTTLLGATPRRVLGSSLLAAVDAALAAAVGGRSPESEVVGVAALARLVAVADLLDDDAVRGTAVAAATLAGRAAANAAPSLAHGLAVLLGGRRPLDHGAALAILLPVVVDLARPALGARLDQAAQAVGTADLVGRLTELRADLGLPSRFDELSISLEDLEAVVRHARAGASWADFPVPLEEGALLERLEAAW